MPESPRPRRVGIVIGLALAAALAVALALGVALVRGGSGLTEEDVRTLVQTRIESEAAEGFVVTGRLSSTLSGSSARRWRLRLLDVETGRAEVTVHVPATMTYGFSLDDFDAEAIRFREDGVVEVVLPPLSVFSVEPQLEDADVEIDLSGQARLTPSLTERTVEQTLHQVRPALRRQAEEHLDTSQQPRVNSARALRRVLASPLEAAGVNLDDVRFRFVIAPGDTLDVNAEGSRRTVPPE
ncbi:DUF4230 domain-containing protein [Rubrivirga marina]|uniref:DUF4230 domain-containing protein n=1 Tax=Rubrivirga marina TaxID=1196024 RepID=A0A271J3Y1_9BACT|nr:DUF4230 domain-containing protein [Rubrivirga marina]PAP78226.1 hypothetical protein BSZ37_18235 [Rubrivirga marina]